MSSTGEGDRPAKVDSPALDRWPTFALDHAIESVGSDGTQCTMYPSDVPEDQRLTAWITADGDSFIGVDEVR